MILLVTENLLLNPDAVPFTPFQGTLPGGHILVALGLSPSRAHTPL
jgi:hypothetical protein